MATLIEKIKQLVPGLGGRKENAIVTNDRHYQELKNLVYGVGGKIHFKNNPYGDIDREEGDNYYDYVGSIELDQRGELLFKGSRRFDGSRERVDFDYGKLSEYKKRTLTDNVREMLGSYRNSIGKDRKEAVLAIQERLLTPGSKELSAEEAYAVDRFLYINRSLGGSDGELSKLTDEAISQAGQGVSLDRIDDVKAELERFRPKIKGHLDLWRWQEIDGLTDEPHFDEGKIAQLRKKYSDKDKANKFSETHILYMNKTVDLYRGMEDHKESRIPDDVMGQKWEELVIIAKEHATGKGWNSGIRWLEDSFNEYLALADSTPGYGMGGQPGSKFNREVLAGKIIQHFDGVGSNHELSDKQLSRLKDSLDGIAQVSPQNNLKV